MSDQCRSCQAPIIWVKTAAGRAIPLDPLVRTVIDEKGAAHRGRESHFASCPNASEHRKEPRPANARLPL